MKHNTFICQSFKNSATHYYGYRQVTFVVMESDHLKRHMVIFKNSFNLIFLSSQTQRSDKDGSQPPSKERGCSEYSQLSLGSCVVIVVFYWETQCVDLGLFVLVWHVKERGQSVILWETKCSQCALTNTFQCFLNSSLCVWIFKAQEHDIHTGTETFLALFRAVSLAPETEAGTSEY